MDPRTFEMYRRIVRQVVCRQASTRGSSFVDIGKLVDMWS